MWRGRIAVGARTWTSAPLDCEVDDQCDHDWEFLDEAFDDERVYPYGCSAYGLEKGVRDGV